ncbi:MAG TPA: zinc ribbon domain-containing protein [Galbitalea sp.]|nr:zinc ribbon domain-containing protein [Galbitalea sp.]
MGTCVGCGSPLAPSWKFCIHCGLAVESPDIPGAIRPDDSAQAKTGTSNRALVLGGIGIFLVGIALLVVAIAFFAGAIH